MKKLLTITSIGLFVVISCMNNSQKKSPAATDEAAADLLAQAQVLFQPISAITVSRPDSAMVKLGKYLFFDTRLSGEGNIS